MTVTIPLLFKIKLWKNVIFHILFVLIIGMINQAFASTGDCYIIKWSVKQYYAKCYDGVVKGTVVSFKNGSFIMDTSNAVDCEKGEIYYTYRLSAFKWNGLYWEGVSITPYWHDTADYTLIGITPVYTLPSGDKVEEYCNNTCESKENALAEKCGADNYYFNDVTCEGCCETDANQYDECLSVENNQGNPTCPDG